MSTRIQIVSAQLTGAADRHTMRGEPGPDAVAELQALAASLHGGERQAALDEAAARYVSVGSDEPWFPRALVLLVAAGADEHRAREIYAARPRTKGLGGLGEQAGQR